MIVSHKHKFIFIKTRKTAGTSIEIILEKYCNESDIVTKIYNKDSKEHQHHPRNHGRFYNHIQSYEVKEILGDKIWNNYYKFTIDRNPWDKMVSMYWWRKHQYKLDDSFEYFCNKALAPDHDNIYTAPNDYTFYTINNQLSVDYVIRFESLEKGLNNVLSKIGLPGGVDIPKAKSEYRKSKQHYSEYYTPELQQQVHEYFNEMITLFGYSFEHAAVA